MDGNKKNICVEKNRGSEKKIGGGKWRIGVEKSVNNINEGACLLYPYSVVLFLFDLMVWKPACYSSDG